MLHFVCKVHPSSAAASSIFINGRSLLWNEDKIHHFSLLGLFWTCCYLLYSPHPLLTFRFRSLGGLSSWSPQESASGWRNLLDFFAVVSRLGGFPAHEHSSTAVRSGNGPLPGGSGAGCRCVCVCVNLLHLECQNTYSTSKVRTFWDSEKFWSFLTTSKDCFRFKTWLLKTLGSGDGVVRVGSQIMYHKDRNTRMSVCEELRLK